MTERALRDGRQLALLLLPLSVLALVLGLSLLHQSLLRQGRSVAGDSALVGVAGPPTPAAARPSPAWRPPLRTAAAAPSAGRPAVPSRLRIPSIGLDVDVTPVGVSADGQLSLPERPDRVGWYRYGPRPGSDQGSAVLAGHLDSRRYGIGPLAAVGRIDAGDVVLVTTGRKTLRFGVEEVLRVPKRTLDLDRLFTREGRPLLRIVTCGGAYDPDRGGYQDNVIVTARPR